MRSFNNLPLPPPPLLLLLLNLLLCQLGCRSQLLRHFEFWRTANFRDPANWRSGAAPCPRDSVRLPLKSAAPIGLSGGAPAVVRELLLPRDGVLVLLDGSGLQAFDPQSSTPSTKNCGSDDIHEAVFNLTQPQDWLRPDNWRPTGYPAVDIFDALPIDRLPAGACDAAAFDASSVFFVNAVVGAAASSLPLGQLEFAGRSFGGLTGESSTADEFEAFWRGSALTRTQLAGGAAADAAPPPLSIVACDFVAGSAPQPVLTPQLMRRVCAGRSGDCAAASSGRSRRCRSPIPATALSGACCGVCGVAVSIEASDLVNFNLRRLKMELRAAVGRLAGGGTAAAADSPLRLSLVRNSSTEATYQIVLTAAAASASSGGADDAGAAIEAIVKWLHGKAGALGYKVLATRRSDGIGGGRSHGTVSGSSSAKSAVGLGVGLTVVGLLVAAAVAAVVVGHRRGLISLDVGKAWRVWQQRRHRTLQEEETGGGGGDVVDFSAARQSVSMSTVSMAFTNPVYDVAQPQFDVPEEDREM